MNFYEELERECKKAGLSGKIITVPEDLKPTQRDFIELASNIYLKTEENRNMLFLSEEYAKNNLPCGGVKILTKTKAKK